jgi:catechol 2,3-dioxygenase-like lactoylglutathione lyase family enzyme
MLATFGPVTELLALCLDAHDPQRLAAYWAALLGRERVGDTLLPREDAGFRFRFLPAAEPKRGQNHMHFDLTSTSLEDQQNTVARALALGGQHIDVGQLPDERHVVLADPEGNEFCVIEPGNNFLAGCGFEGAVSSDGSQAVGYFWSEALGWPLVWDENEETAIQSPYHGTKITWGGPPVAPKTGKGRLHLDLTAADPQAEADRLISLGAKRIDLDQHPGEPHAALSDPDGNEFCVFTTGVAAAGRP